MIDTANYFTEALDLRKHPILRAKGKKRLEYCRTLTYIVNSVMDNVIQQDTGQNGFTDDAQNIQNRCVIQSDIFKSYISQRLKLYYERFGISQGECPCPNKTQMKELFHTLSPFIAFPWKNKLWVWLLCDASLILLDYVLIDKVNALLKMYSGKRTRVSLDILVAALHDSKMNTDKLQFADCLIKQYQLNNDFSKIAPKKFIVTANMSAGKSTLINALIGKNLARTSQEACTGNICYMYNKAFEDNLVSLASSDLSLNASLHELSSYLWQDAISISSYFTGIDNICSPVCMIDTPGVNAALHKEHSKITRHALKNQDYDRLLYVISPVNLGTDAEVRHLKWIAENTEKEKIIFILNKLDDFHSESDNLSESMADLRTDLLKLGFASPIICPISAYFGYLLKLKLINQTLSEDESDEYTLLAKKFSKAKYDLSHCYENSQVKEGDTEEIKLCKACGLYGLEKILYGGTE